MVDDDARCIGIDWGTSRFRAYLLNGSGQIVARQVSNAGVASVAAGQFERTLVHEVGAWLDAFPTANVVASGMVGSRQGWLQTRYVQIPVDLSKLSVELEQRTIGRRRVAFTPGLTRVGQDGMPDVMRGEEVQVFGSLAELGGDGWCVLPGTHSKWVQVEAGAIVWFASFLSGELYDVLLRHSVLTLGEERTPDTSGAAFLRGLDFANSTAPESGGLLKRLFSTRSFVGRGEMSRAEASEYLSGLIIGSEVREALASMPGEKPKRLLVIGTSELLPRYRTAFERAGIEAVGGPVDAAARGHYAIAVRAGLL
jgi:2-dehydro-3-deoxygalactonokinase